MGPGLRRWLAEAAALVSAAGLALALGACGGRQDPVGSVAQSSAPLPAGAALYCIANVGHTGIAYSLAQRQALPDTARYLALDPVGPWYAGGEGYYLSRVDTSGAGANALIQFDPKTTVEQARLRFPADSNPNSLLLLPAPHAGLAWVALRGSTFDNFATDGISVVNLATMQDTAFCDLNAATPTCPRLVPNTGTTLTSPLGFRWDAACNGGSGCAYAVVNNFDGTVRNGRLLALAPDAQGRPTLLASAALGRNPLQDTVLSASGELWVVNNGGYVHYDPSGQPGTLQALDTTNHLLNLTADPDGDGLPGRTLAIESAATCAGLPRPDPGCDPTGIYSLDGQTAWVTTYPDDVLRTVDLTTDTLLPLDPGLPAVTGPFFPVTIDPLAADGHALFAGLGGLGLARLGELDRGVTTLLRDDPLQAGAGPLSCAALQVP